MACPCHKNKDIVRRVVFPDGSTMIVDTEEQARGEIVAHGGGTWVVLRGQAATDARTAAA
jgi:hypothetical protein